MILHQHEGQLKKFSFEYKVVCNCSLTIQEKRTKNILIQEIRSKITIRVKENHYFDETDGILQKYPDAFLSHNLLLI